MIIVAVRQPFLICDDLQISRGKDGSMPSLEVPTRKRRNGRGPVERVVQLDGAEFSDVVAERVAGLHTCEIEDADPPFGREGAGADESVPDERP